MFFPSSLSEDALEESWSSVIEREIFREEACDPQPRGGVRTEERTNPFPLLDDTRAREGWVLLLALRVVLFFGFLFPLV